MASDLPALKARVEAARAKVHELGDDFWHLYLLALATDLLAALDVSERRHRHRDDVEKDMARQRDEAVQEAGRLRGEHHSLRDVLQWVNDQCPGKCSAVCDSALRAGHEGQHTKAPGDNGGSALAELAAVRPPPRSTT